jgi:excisionase family DNA binding protein
MPQHYMTVKEAAARLRVHDRTVRAYLREHKLKKYTTPTGRVRLDEDEVEKFITDRSAGVRA